MQETVPFARGAALAGALATTLAAGTAEAARPYYDLGGAGRLGSRTVFEPPPPDPDEQCAEAFDAHLAALADDGFDLGAPLGDIEWQEGWCYRLHEHGALYDTTPVHGFGPVAVLPPFYAEFVRLGMHDGPLGRPLVELEPSADEEGLRARFVRGSINWHPELGTHTVLDPIDHLWEVNGADARFGHPLASTAEMPLGLGRYTVFESGFGESTPEMGPWLDFTGAGGMANVAGSVTLYEHPRFLGRRATFPLSGEIPLVFRAQLAAAGLEDRVSAARLDGIPRTASVYLYEHPDLSGRYVRVTGFEDGGRMNVRSLGGWMNDRLSAVQLVNHGTASVRVTADMLRALVEPALDQLDPTSLLGGSAEDAVDVAFEWAGDVEVTIVPGERVIRLSREALIDVDAECARYFTCNADGRLRFTVDLRPNVGDLTRIRVDVAGGTAEALTCDGLGCGDLRATLDGLFDGYAVIALVEEKIAGALADIHQQLALLAFGCAAEGFGVRRVNVLPDAVEVVLADTPAAASCILEVAGDPAASVFDTDRPAGLIEGSDGSRTTIVPARSPRPRPTRFAAARRR